LGLEEPPLQPGLPRLKIRLDIGDTSAAALTLSVKKCFKLRQNGVAYHAYSNNS
jgi:hypothetical protein